MSEEEVYCMDCGYVYTPRNYLGKSRCIKCGSEDYASKDWECGDVEENKHFFTSNLEKYFFSCCFDVCIDKLNSLLAGLEARSDCGAYNEPMDKVDREMLGLINESIKSIRETIDGIHEATQTEQWLL